MIQFRAEGLHESTTREFVPGFVYYDERRYRDGYTNGGNLMGSAFGRAGLGGQGWLTYSFAPRTQIELGYRLQQVSKEFVGGGRLADYLVRGNLHLRDELGISGLLQYEQWQFPVLQAGRQSDFTASFQLTFYPKWTFKNGMNLSERKRNERMQDLTGVQAD
jgi:hypothetical protein